MFPVKRTIFVQFQFFLRIPPVFLGGIIPPFTFAALQRNQFHHLLLASHKNLLNIPKSMQKNNKSKQKTL